MTFPSTFAWGEINEIKSGGDDISDGRSVYFVKNSRYTFLTNFWIEG